VLAGWWYFNYWTTYVLNFVVLPFLMEYIEAGEFTYRGKVKRSLIRNLPYYILYAIMLSVCIVFLMTTEFG